MVEPITSQDCRKLTIIANRMLFLVIPVALFALLATAVPAKALREYNYVYIDIVNEVNRTLSVEVEQYDVYYGERDRRTAVLSPGQSQTFYFEPTAYLWWTATYQYNIKIDELELQLELDNSIYWGVHVPRWERTHTNYRLKFIADLETDRVTVGGRDTARAYIRIIP